MTLIPMMSFAQERIEGNWNGKIIVNGYKNTSVYHEWFFDKDKVMINLVFPDTTKQLDIFKYKKNEEQIKLENETSTVIFNILSEEEHKLTIENKADNYVIFLNRTEAIQQVDFELPYDKRFQLIAEGYNNISVYFTQFFNQDYVIIEHDTLIYIHEVSYIWDTLYSEYILDMRYAIQIGNNRIDYLLIEKHDKNFISGRLNDHIPFELTSKVLITPIITEAQLTTKDLIQGIDNDVFFLNLKKEQQISIRKNKFNLKKNQRGVYKRWIEHKVSSYLIEIKVKWKISGDGRFLFITLHDNKREINSTIFYIKKMTQDAWSFYSYRSFFP
jgi:hypothetical protein